MRDFAGRPMIRPLTAKEQAFEDFVNEEQGLMDDRVEYLEWYSLREYEEAVLDVYYQFGQDMEKFSVEMRRWDQQQMEAQCQRKNDKARNLKIYEAHRAVVMKAVKAQEEAKAKRAALKATVEASSSPLVKTRTFTNTAGSQKGSQQCNLGKTKPEEHRSLGQSASSARACPARQPEHKTKSSGRDLLQQLRAQGALPENRKITGQPSSSSEAPPSTQQEQEPKPSKEELRRQFQAQVQARAATTKVTKVTANVTMTSVQPAAPESSQGTQVQARIATANVTSMQNMTVTNVQPAAPKPTQGPVRAELAGYRMRMDMDPKTHYPKQHVLLGDGLGVSNSHPRSSSQVEQGPNNNNGQGANTLHGDPATVSSEVQSTSPSPQEPSSEESSPSSSANPSPPKTPASSPPDAGETRTKDPSIHEQDDGVDNVNSLLELQRATYPNAKPSDRWGRLRQSLQHNVLLHSIIRRQIEHEKWLQAERERKKRLLEAYYRSLAHYRVLVIIATSGAWQQEGAPEPDAESDEASVTRSGSTVSPEDSRSSAETSQPEGPERDVEGDDGTETGREVAGEEEVTEPVYVAGVEIYTLWLVDWLQFGRC